MGQMLKIKFNYLSFDIYPINFTFKDEMLYKSQIIDVTILNDLIESIAVNSTINKLPPLYRIGK